MHADTLRPPVRLRYLLPIALAALAARPEVLRPEPAVTWWVSSQDMSAKLAARPALAFAPADPAAQADITIDTTTTYQTIFGLGSSLEHSTCYNVRLLPPERQDQVVESLVSPETGIGMNLMRVCIGTPDFTASPWYSYNDLPAGEQDPRLERFSIEKDRAYVLPVLKLALSRQSWGVQPVTPEVIAAQQKIADTFFALGLLPKPVTVADATRGNGS